MHPTGRHAPPADADRNGRGQRGAGQGRRFEADDFGEAFTPEAPRAGIADPRPGGGAPEVSRVCRSRLRRGPVRSATCGLLRNSPREREVRGLAVSGAADDGEAEVAERPQDPAVSFRALVHLDVQLTDLRPTERPRAS